MPTPKEAADAADFGVPSARKTGRDPRWPYVPVVITTDAETGQERQEQILRLAYATRAEALASAERTIDRRRAALLEKLVQPRYRALRSQYGVEEQALA